MELSVKERVLQQFEKEVWTIRPFQNTPDHVGREELTEGQQNMGLALACLDGEENFVYQTAYLQVTVQITIDYAVKLAVGDIASTKQGAVLAALKKVLLSNVNLIEEGSAAQLTENIQIREYFPDRAGPTDDVATAAVTFDVIYREDKENPYRLF